MDIILQYLYFSYIFSDRTVHFFLNITKYAERYNDAHYEKKVTFMIYG